jgi:hypothetical protein
MSVSATTGRAYARFVTAAISFAIVSLMSAPAFAQAAPDTTKRAVSIAIGLVIFVACCGFGGWMLRSGKRNAQLALASQGWPSVAGKVLSSDLTTRTQTERINNMTSQVPYFTPRVRYAYEVGGASHQCDVIRFGDLEEGYEPRARAFCEKYPAGATVTVHYDPQNPGTATLETQSAAGSQVWMGYALVGLGILALVLFGFIAYTA